MEPTDIRCAGTRRVGLLGYGAIGRHVAAQLRAARVPGCRLNAVLARRSHHGVAEQVNTIAELVEKSDIVVEAAGHQALTAFGPTITSKGVHLFVASAGALVDDDLLTSLRGSEGAGRVLVSTGAIGGLDVLRAANLLSPFDEVSLETTKQPHDLLQPWMAPDLVQKLRYQQGRAVVFDGTAREAAKAFPQDANVAATLGLALCGLDETTVTVVGDPAAPGPRHVIRALGGAGAYEISIANLPSASNPRTSAITPLAIVRGLGDINRPFVVGI